MKLMLRWILLIAMLGLTACQQGDAGNQTADVTPPSLETSTIPTPPLEQPYPLEPTLSDQQQVYPQPEATEPSGDAYPGPGSNQRSEIAWEEAQELIQSGEVAQVTQLHDLTVILTMRDGQVYETTEPEIDDVFDVLEECGDACADMIVATE